MKFKKSSYIVLILNSLQVTFIYVSVYFSPSDVGIIESENISHLVMSNYLPPWTEGYQAPLFMEFSRQKY